MKAIPASCSQRLALGLALALAAPLAAVDGDVDPAFSGNGIVSWTNGGQVTVHAVAASDKLAIGVGEIELDGGGFELHWHAFDQAGVSSGLYCAQASSTLISSATDSRASAAIVDSTGNLVVGGFAYIGADTTQLRPFLARFELSGSGCQLDTSFSTDGRIVLDTGVCYSESCEIEDIVEIRPETGAVAEPRIVALIDRSAISESERQLALVALTSSGIPDTGFGVGGWAGLAVPGADEHFAARLSVGARGRLYVLAEAYDADLAESTPILARYDADGELDPGFGTAGVASLVDAGGPERGDLAVTEDGVAFATLLKYNAAKYQMEFLGYSDESAESDSLHTQLGTLRLAVQGDGKVVSAGDLGDLDGTGTDGLVLSRRAIDFAGDLPFDSTFGTNGSRTLDVDVGIFSFEKVTALTLWNGRPLVAGTAAAIDRPGFLLRSKSSYVFADGFEGGTPAPWSAAPGINFP